MKIVNQTNQAVLAEDAVLANTLWTRGKGLLGRKELRPKEALVIRPCNSIHTFFMRFAIDVLFVDKNNKIIKAISSLKPFRLTPVYFNAHFVVELPAGTLQATGTSPNHTLSFLPSPDRF